MFSVKAHLQRQDETRCVDSPLQATCVYNAVLRTKSSQRCSTDADWSQPLMPIS